MHVLSLLIVWNDVKEIAMLLVTGKLIGCNWVPNTKSIASNWDELVVVMFYLW